MYGDNTEDEMFFVFLDYVLYEEGDEDISLDTPLLTSVTPLERGMAEVRLQPNPASAQVQVLVDPTLLGTRWSLTDLGGRMVMHGEFSATNGRILLGGLSDGVYLFRNVAGAERLVIQH